MTMTLKAARVNAGLTQKQVAEHIGVNKGTVCSWETGKTDPSIATFAKLCDLYGVQPNDVFLPIKSN